MSCLREALGGQLLVSSRLQGGAVVLRDSVRAGRALGGSRRGTGGRVGVGSYPGRGGGVVQGAGGGVFGGGARGGVFGGVALFGWASYFLGCGWGRSWCGVAGCGVEGLGRQGVGAALAWIFGVGGSGGGCLLMGACGSRREGRWRRGAWAPWTVGLVAGPAGGRRGCAAAWVLARSGRCWLAGSPLSVGWPGVRASGVVGVRSVYVRVFGFCGLWIDWRADGRSSWGVIQGGSGCGEVVGGGEVVGCGWALGFGRLCGGVARWPYDGVFAGRRERCLRSLFVPVGFGRLVSAALAGVGCVVDGGRGWGPRGLLGCRPGPRFSQRPGEGSSAGRALGWAGAGVVSPGRVCAGGGAVGVDVALGVCRRWGARCGESGSRERRRRGSARGGWGGLAGRAGRGSGARVFGGLGGGLWWVCGGGVCPGGAGGLLARRVCRGVGPGEGRRLGVVGFSLRRLVGGGGGFILCASVESYLDGTITDAGT
ncbi:hypothetical protein FKM82_012330 [Ascaphus truei]